MRKATKGALAAGVGAVIAGAVVTTAGAGPLAPDERDAAQAQSAHSATGASAKPAKKQRLREDFNGDGYNDLVIAAPEGSGKAGYVTVVYGSAKGLDRSTRTVISQNTPGVPGEAKAGNRFGDGLVARDLDGDGVTDLAVQSAGAHVILWGAKGGGLSGKGAVRTVDASDAVGGDFDGDGKQDLFVAQGSFTGKGELLRGPFTRDGKPASRQAVDLSDGDSETYGLAAGDITGDGADDVVVLRAMEESSRPGALFVGGKKGLTKKNDDAPEALGATVGDFDGDGHGDLAYRVAPGGVVEGPWDDAGTVKVRYGTASGLGKRTATFTQATPGVPGAHEKGDLFGASLAAGDVTGDGRDDLAVGVPGEAIGSKKKAGSTVLLKGSAKGLTGTGAQAFSQDTAGVPGVAEANDEFGTNTRLLDFDKNGRADLAVSAAGENDFAGAVWAFPGTGSGLDTAKGISFAPGDVGAPAQGATFGAEFANSTPSPLWGIQDR
ncbi:FG-GAP-like repeat-containing protein [Streptomyces sp. ODS28]|uniref:FG-GAP and VCBS repeat-containing protein n=1 Tax=Streptomyces sp. ODS28 TaxID=3136688 RepID=UPI0031EAAB95